jgi:excisionase family DNA binding protein
VSTSFASHPGQQSFLTPQEVSNLLRVSVYTVRRWIKNEELPAYKIGRLWRIKKVDLDQWLNQQRPTTTASSQTDYS